MSTKTLSIIMASYRRAPQLSKTLESISIQTRQPHEIIVAEDGYDGGATEKVCSSWETKGLPVQYLCRKNRPKMSYSNPAVPKNIGIRRATGEILIIQCPEVMYATPHDIENLVGPVEKDEALSLYAPCNSLDAKGLYEEQMCGPGFSHHSGVFRFLPSSS